MRSHDQWNTTIYSDNDRYRGVKNLRTLIFMNADDMRERGLGKFDLVDITSYRPDGSTRSVLRLPRRSATTSPAAARPGTCRRLNVLCAIGDYSTQSGTTGHQARPSRRDPGSPDISGPLTAAGIRP